MDRPQSTEVRFALDDLEESGCMACAASGRTASPARTARWRRFPRCGPGRSEAAVIQFLQHRLPPHIKVTVDEPPSCSPSLRRPETHNRAMETKWLEDFVSLAETRSFSRSAQLRHVTQPAFSRRIQALEAWAGTDLVDRSSYPTRLTPAGETLYAQALEMLQALQSTRAMMRGHSAAAHDVIEFAVPHTLAFTFFPAWVSALREKFGPIKSRLIALNVHDAVMRLVEGRCDI